MKECSARRSIMKVEEELDAFFIPNFEPSSQAAVAIAKWLPASP